MVAAAGLSWLLEGCWQSSGRNQGSVSWLAGHWGALEGRGLRPEPGSFPHAKIDTRKGPFEEAEGKGVLLPVS